MIRKVGTMGIHKPIFPPLANLPPGGGTGNRRVSSGFAGELQKALQETGGLTVSKHAMERMEKRNIVISDRDWKTIGEKVEQAKKMGVKESLVLLRDAALIVSASNGTVITAMDQKEAGSQIFTNINGAIIIH
nr:flagellar protein [Bacillaceae bacterium]